jgi:hypothetical protein
MDFRLDKEGKHNAYIRGTLAGNKEDVISALAQFPGQPAASLALNNSWMKGKHTIQTGINFRFVTNDRFNYGPSFPTYSMSRGTMLGLGGDITNSITEYLRTRDGLSSSISLTNTNALQNAVGTYLGMITSLDVTYQFDKTGKAIAIGTPQVRSFKTNEYEFYVQDSWRATRDLNFTFGLRYSNYGVPYEANGLQVNTTVPLDTYFAERDAQVQPRRSGQWRRA